MKRLVLFFTNPHAKRETTIDNPLAALLYGLAYPLARLLASLRVSPNQITVLSCVFSAAAFGLLATGAPAFQVALCWGAAVVLDFCDGTVARMCARTSRTAFRFDHFSDVAKICAVILGAGIRYDDKITWIVVAGGIFSFLYYTLLNHELNSVRTRAAEKPQIGAPTRSWRRSAFEEEAGVTLMIRMLRVVYVTFGTIGGHTLLCLLLLPFGREAAMLAIAYMVIVTSCGAAVRIRYLLAIPRK